MIIVTPYFSDPPESVHSIDWNPGKDEFAVVYGRIPANSSIFSGTGEKVLDIGRFKYNYVKFNRQGTHLLLGGFGNLVGDIVIIIHVRVRSRDLNLTMSEYREYGIWKRMRR